MAHGSFTGIRIGIATIKAFSDARNIKVEGINSLEGLAYKVILEKNLEKNNEEIRIACFINAKNENSYFGMFTFKNGNLSVYKNISFIKTIDAIDYIDFDVKTYLIRKYRFCRFISIIISKN